jgi:hypothetical protein
LRNEHESKLKSEYCRANIDDMILYKYLQPERLDVLKHRKIRFTQPGDFNDPFEFRPCIATAMEEGFTAKYLEDNFDQLVEENLEKYASIFPSIPKELVKPLLLAQKDKMPKLLKLLDPTVIKAIAPKIDQALNQSVGVLCLSEVRDSLLMWGHYTDNHRGFVVGFDSEHSFFSKRKTGTDELGFLRQVQYQGQRPAAVLTDTSSLVWFQTKSEEWAYEKEWRIIRSLREARSRIEVGVFPVFLFEFPPDAVLQIVVGLRATSSLLREIQDLIPSFPRASLFQARESPTNYALLVEPVDRGKSAEI